MDSGLEGFGIRVFPSGRKTFFVRYRHARGFRRVTLGSHPELTLRRARAEAEVIIGRVASETSLSCAVRSSRENG
jgi:Arm domain-containing DNA-binding protein